MPIDAATSNLLHEAAKAMEKHACYFGNGSPCRFCASLRPFVTVDHETNLIAFKDGLSLSKVEAIKEAVRRHVSIYSTEGKKSSALYRSVNGYYFDIEDFSQEELKELADIIVARERFNTRLAGYVVADMLEFVGLPKILQMLDSKGVDVSFNPRIKFEVQKVAPSPGPRIFSKRS